MRGEDHDWAAGIDGPPATRRAAKGRRGPGVAAGAAPVTPADSPGDTARDEAPAERPASRSRAPRAARDERPERSRKEAAPDRPARSRSGSADESTQRSRPGADLPPPELVTDDRALARLCEHLGTVDDIAIDTEADSFFSYRERVCLVQVSTPAGDWVIDPLAELDLAPIGRVLADPTRRKIFHDGEYDVLLFKREHGFDFSNLFDTRVAAAALGYDAVGLAGVLERHFGVVLDKKQQLSDWSKRPLTDEQIRYARLDTHYLVELTAQLEALLEERGRMPIVEGECARLEAMEVPDRAFDPDEFMRLKGARNLDLTRMQVLRELFIARDEMASARNVPPFKIVPHGALVEAASRRPRNARELEQVGGMSRKLVQRVGKQLLDAIERGRELGPLDQAPRLPAKDGTDRLDERGTELHDRLKTLRKKLADKEGFDSSLAINRRTLLDLAAKAPTAVSDLEQIEGLLPWQIDAFGEPIVRAIAAFSRDWENGDVQPRRGAGRRRG
jgi:ribonuclease D